MKELNRIAIPKQATRPVVVAGLGGVCGLLAGIFVWDDARSVVASGVFTASLAACCHLWNIPAHAARHVHLAGRIFRPTFMTGWFLFGLGLLGIVRHVLDDIGPFLVAVGSFIAIATTLGFGGYVLVVDLFGTSFDSASVDNGPQCRRTDGSP